MGSTVPSSCVSYIVSGRAEAPMESSVRNRLVSVDVIRLSSVVVCQCWALNSSLHLVDEVI